MEGVTVLEKRFKSQISENKSDGSIIWLGHPRQKSSSGSHIMTQPNLAHYSQKFSFFPHRKLTFSPRSVGLIFFNLHLNHILNKRRVCKARMKTEHQIVLVMCSLGFIGWSDVRFVLIMFLYPSPTLTTSWCILPGNNKEQNSLWNTPLLRKHVQTLNKLTQCQRTNILFSVKLKVKPSFCIFFFCISTYCLLLFLSAPFSGLKKKIFPVTETLANHKALQRVGVPVGCSKN